jgi:hypothetical protein
MPTSTSVLPLRGQRKIAERTTSDYEQLGRARVVEEFHLNDAIERSAERRRTLTPSNFPVPAAKYTRIIFGYATPHLANAIKSPMFIR